MLLSKINDHVPLMESDILLLCVYTDIDECEGLHDCHHNTTCANLPGTYQCNCLDEFFMNGDNDCITVKSPTGQLLDSITIIILHNMHAHHGCVLRYKQCRTINRH